MPTGFAVPRAVAQLQAGGQGHQLQDERYAYGFGGKPVITSRKALAVGDHAVERDGQLVAAVGRKSLADLVPSLTSGKLKFACGLRQCLQPSRACQQH